MIDPAAPNTTAELLLGCERDLPHLRYGAPVVEYSLESGEIVVVSDLHLGAGLRSDRTYSRTENFFSPAAFRRFLENRMALLGPSGPRATLVINGDVVDFVRIMEIPESDADFERWGSILASIGIGRSAVELRRSITRKEQVHGLKTNDYKAVWKLDTAVQGHAVVFDALAAWVGAGHRLVVTKGNHDLEWYWPAVRNYFRLVLARRLEGDLSDNLRRQVLPRVRFVDDSLVIDRVLYLEHGHRYDRFCWPIGSATIGDGRELNLPFGSFFNRYLINHVELDYPYIDNVRPAENVLPLLIREHFPTALRLLFAHVPFMFRVIPKRYFRYIFGNVAVLALAVGLPVAVAVALLGREIAAVVGGVGTWSSSLPVLARFVWNEGLKLSGSLGGLLMSYVLARLAAALQLKSPGDLTDPGRRRLDQDPSLRFVVLGHTHNPAQSAFGGRWVYNTGTWVPVIETSTADVRHDRTYTFLHLRRGSDGSLSPGVIERWVDEAGRAAPLALLERRA